MLEGVEGGGVTQLAYHPLDPNVLFVASRRSNALQVFDLRDASQPISQLGRPASSNQRITFDLDPWGRWITSGDEVRSCRNWADFRTACFAFGTYQIRTLISSWNKSSLTVGYRTEQTDSQMQSTLLSFTYTSLCSSPQRDLELFCRTATLSFPRTTRQTLIQIVTMSCLESFLLPKPRMPAFPSGQWPTLQHNTVQYGSISRTAHTNCQSQSSEGE